LRVLRHLCVTAAHEAHVGFVHEGRRLEGLPRFLLSELLSGHPAQLVIDQRQEMLGGTRIAQCDGGQQAGDFGH
jgi:hypothetical protein